MSKKRRIISAKVSFKRCKGCSAYWKGIIRDEKGKIERIISCNQPCFLLKKTKMII